MAYPNLALHWPTKVCTVPFYFRFNATANSDDRFSKTRGSIHPLLANPADLYAPILHSIIGLSSGNLEKFLLDANPLAVRTCVESGPLAVS